jgi:riboflavin kinase / FMN adenylyltransferase
VVKGNQLGRTLGYPTANLEPDSAEKLIPADGVYAVEAQLLPDGAQSPALFEGKKLKGMMGIGIRPTINGTHRTIEVNLFDFDQDIYGQEMRVFVIKYLRPELKFNNLDELKAALAQDKLDSLAALA